MRALRNRDRSEKYICTAENYKANTKLGDCGEVKTLMGWLIHLTHEDEDQLNRFFDDSYPDVAVKPLSLDMGSVNHHGERG